MAANDIIEYTGGGSTFVFKHPIENINPGTKVIVRESQEAILLQNGKAIEVFEPGLYTLTPESRPLLKLFFKKSEEQDVPLRMEVYFINLATIMGVKWGTDSKVRLYDPATKMHLEIGAHGEFNIRVSNSAELITKLVGTEFGLTRQDIVGTTGYSTSSATGKFRALVMSKVKSVLPRAIRENDIDILAVDEYLEIISEYIKEELNTALASYGLTLPEFFVTEIATPDDDPNFRRLKQQHADRYLRVEEERIRKAEAEAKRDRVKVEAETAADVKIISAEADAEATKKKAQANAEHIRAEGLARPDVIKAVNSPIEATWVCPSCGHEGNRAKFCEECGAKKPEIGTWTCPACGHEGNVGKFCEECGAKKPEQPSTWKCPSCGHEGNTAKFCAKKD